MRKRKQMTMVRQMMLRYDCDEDSTNDGYRVLLILEKKKIGGWYPFPTPFSLCAC